MASQKLFKQEVEGSRKLSNYLVGGMVSIGGIGFLLAAISSYLGKDLLPIGNPSSLIFVPQGILMGAYGLLAIILASYLWALISINYGSGCNIFNKELDILRIFRKGLFRDIDIELSLKDIQAVKLEVREGLNPLRRISLKIKGKKDLPITEAGQLPELEELEREGAKLARYLDVNLEGI